MKTTSVLVFKKCLMRLVGLRCWAVTAGSGTGTHVVLDFGKKVKRAKPIRNKLLDDVSRNFTGEWSFFIENCAWRLDLENEMLCSSKSDNRADGEMLIGLRKIIGKQVVALRLNHAGKDLEVEFDKGLNLSLFADSADEREGDNYSVFAPSMIWTVGPRGILRVEAR